MGKVCCALKGGSDAFKYLKMKLTEMGLHGPDKIRVSQSGCLGRCSLGPCLVIYPEAVWYTYHSHTDLDEILQTHLVDEGSVPRLFIA